MKRKDREFLNEAENKTVVVVGRFKEELSKGIRRKVAENMLEVVKHARRMGVEIEQGTLPNVVVANAFIGRDKDSEAYYQYGTIHLKERSFDNRRILAHELFHHVQETMAYTPYNTHKQRAYGEGGADFFAVTFEGRGFGNRGKAKLILNGLNRDMNYKMLFKQIKRLDASGRYEFLYSLLGEEGAAGDGESRYEDGGRFVVMALRINNGDVKDTLRLLANHGLEETIGRLSDLPLTLREKFDAYRSALSSLPEAVRLGSFIRKAANGLRDRDWLAFRRWDP